MTEYTFHSLSDADFEDLARDLLEAKLGLTFQAFTKGRDSGIDLLHGAGIVGSVVVQCKHYWRSGFPKLKSTIERNERPKVARLVPTRFILVTSVGLTPANKEELRLLLAPHCKGVDDIYGCSDLNAMLRAYPAVEKAHYKLWLTSVPVLQNVLRHGATVWNTMSKDEIERKMSLYVQTEAYGAALDILKQHNYCVLSGIPGIGKTTLAQVIVTRLMEEGYELISVRDDINEAFDALDFSKKQVVYYDDFLGQSSLGERLGKNEDRGIARLLTEARRSRHLKVVFTTREYILEEAKRVYEPLSRAGLDVAKCIVKVEDYTRWHRARILYNHVYFSGLALGFAAALAKNRGYLRIIDHGGYSPRIVEWMTIGGGAYGTSPSDYVDRFLKILDDPAQVWQHAFDSQIGEEARAILFSLGSVEGSPGLEELRASWGALQFAQVQRGFAIEDKRAFNAAMKQLEGSFTRCTRFNSETAVSFHNPSIKDYVRRRIVGDDDTRLALLRAAQHFEQVACLVSLNQGGKVAAPPSCWNSDHPALHDAISRTLQAKASIYYLTRYRADGEMRLTRADADVGARLTQIALWARSSNSPVLLSKCCDLAADIVCAGDVADAATTASCGFLDVVMAAFPSGEQDDRVIGPFLAQIKLLMAGSSSIDDWQHWTELMKSNARLFGADEATEWARHAEAFCVAELESLLENSSSSSDLVGWFDQVQELAAAWGVSLDGEERFQGRLGELQDREEGPDRDDDWREIRPVGRIAGGDADIDRLFESLENGSRDQTS